MSAQAILDDILNSGRKFAADLAKASKPLADAAVTSTEIAYRAGQDLVAGRIDLEGAGNVARRGFEQLRTLAVGEGNLAAAASADWASALIQGIFKMLVPIKL